jgi:hypothetical protein
VPRLSRWFVRASLVYLCLGFTLGALLLANKGMPLHPLLWRVLPAHVEFLLLGWTVSLAMGVAFWILPRFGGSRGDEKPAWAAFALFNAGVILAGLAPALGWPAPAALMGRALEAAGAAAFAVHAWPRVRPLAG